MSLPDLKYDTGVNQAQGKGSTKWAAHSHTPVSVAEWKEFDGLIKAEGQKRTEVVTLERSIASAMDDILRKNPVIVKEEEHVTTNTVAVLNQSRELLGCLFSSGSKFLKSNPDIVSTEEGSDQKRKFGPASAYASPQKGRLKHRVETAAAVREETTLPIETKPHWLFRFLTENDPNLLFELWEVPEQCHLTQRTLPEPWSPNKKKVLHLIRQMYGQMVTDNFRYGVINLYELWYFCRRDADGSLHISRGFLKSCKSPSVLQALRTILSFSDLKLTESSSHTASPLKALAPRSNGRPNDNSPDERSSGNDSDTKQGEDGHEKSSGESPSANVLSMHIAPDGSLLKLSECQLIMDLDNCKIMLTKCGRGIVKMVPAKRKLAQQALAMRHEAHVYQELQNTVCARFIPTFYGFDESLGVPILCVGAEDDDFEDIGLENLPLKLRLSAMEGIRALSACGWCHGDLELRNIVRARDDPTRAKIIDFGKSHWTKDKTLLAAQVSDAAFLLGM